ncbi:two component, sigma54 specific, transcriptional regulator, Fis family [Peptoclostridium litorale DSM 5388]|uniref:Stage 0 sporulation protein A homolog n=1 Tax=Peptoclostridium litorale DSM 5388 TaxID=1121324 RepID=A0A069RIR6_PEPLI|nr:sigma-54 dependent transcriptional regulator [Peptoclostridium litorale]KDR96673.1 acetoacetate metabolism regulatory protein AtoC [Peptoclostridium litorale DSM 5388]SIN67862.1 two component, sigma54 specific, transcriptional regulator, Fis family [Peptoclostridium litorale DSM 5388]
MRNKILVADDEKNMLWAIKAALKKEDYDIITASDGMEALEKFKENMPQLVILDLKMPGMDGMEALRQIKSISQKVSVIMITAHGSVDSAIEAMKIGALDYISKPFDVEELKITIKKALDVEKLKDTVDFLTGEIKSKEKQVIIGKSQKMKDVFELVDKVSKSDATVLITGESGTGKELLANAIHYRSKRKSGPYVKVNCGSIPENLLESELFGYEKGAFTGAAARKIGKFERADGGSIFLDEVGELPLAMQVKFLRVLQEMEIERVGGTESLGVDVRIIAATNKDLEKMVEDGLFREDLYYRLNVIPIAMPALRERAEDIPLLIEHFLKKYSKKMSMDKLEIDSKAVEAMEKYKWKGNIRELENLIERIVILCESDTVGVEDLPIELLRAGGEDFEFALPKSGIDLEKVEKSFIVQALQASGGNQTKAAKLLGITRHTLIYRMEKYDTRQ